MLSIHLASNLLIALPVGAILYYLMSWPKSIRKSVSLCIGAVAAILAIIGKRLVTSYDQPTQWLALFLLASSGGISCFKSVNAALNQYPDGADANLVTWLFWFFAFPEPVFSKGKLQKANREYFLAKFNGLVTKLVIISVLLGILLQSEERDVPFIQDVLPE